MSPGALLRKLTWLLRRPRPIHGECLACGICCHLYGHTLSASPEDTARWRAEGRVDLLAQVGQDLELWTDPADGTRLEYCPHLVEREHGSAICGIHATKPQMCREYPTPVHGYRCVRGIHIRGVRRTR